MRLKLKWYIIYQQDELHFFLSFSSFRYTRSLFLSFSSTAICVFSLFIILPCCVEWSIGLLAYFTVYFRCDTWRKTAKKKRNWRKKPSSAEEEESRENGKKEEDNPIQGHFPFFTCDSSQLPVKSVAAHTLNSSDSLKQQQCHAIPCHIVYIGQNILNFFIVKSMYLYINMHAQYKLREKKKVIFLFSRYCCVCIVQTWRKGISVECIREDKTVLFQLCMQYHSNRIISREQRELTLKTESSKMKTVPSQDIWVKSLSKMQICIS